MQAQLPFASEPAAPVPVEVYFVRHRWARRYLLRVEPTGRVRVTIPRGGSQREAAAFASAQRAWIEQQVARVSARTPRWSPEERSRLRALARTELPPRLHALAAVHALRVARVTIRDQRARWGSCGRDGHITLNWRLVTMPDEVRDYVLIHELMHLRRQDHSRAFWALVESACPDYRAARRWLRQHGASLL